MNPATSVDPFQLFQGPGRTTERGNCLLRCSLPGEKRKIPDKLLDWQAELAWLL